MRYATTSGRTPGRLILPLGLLLALGGCAVATVANVANSAASAVGALGASDMSDPLPMVVDNRADRAMDVAWHCPELGERVGAYLGRVPAGEVATFELTRRAMCLTPRFFAAATDAGGEVRTFDRTVFTHLTVGRIEMRIGETAAGDRLGTVSRTGPSGVIRR